MGTTYGFKADQGEAEKIEQTREKLGLSKSDLLRQAVEQYLEGKGEQQAPPGDSHQPPSLHRGQEDQDPAKADPGPNLDQEPDPPADPPEDQPKKKSFDWRMAVQVGGAILFGILAGTQFKDPGGPKI